MMSHNHLDYSFGKTVSINGNLDWLIINNLYELVNNDKD